MKIGVSATVRTAQVYGIAVGRRKESIRLLTPNHGITDQCGLNRSTTSHVISCTDAVKPSCGNHFYQGVEPQQCAADLPHEQVTEVFTGSPRVRRATEQKQDSGKLPRQEGETVVCPLLFLTLAVVRQDVLGAGDITLPDCGNAIFRPRELPYQLPER